MKRDDKRVRAPLRNGRRDWYRMKAEEGDAPAEIFIYDEIGYWGVTASDFARDLKEIDAESITVRVNSPGGDVFDGIAILNALRGHKATITTVVDGLAASAASFIAMAGDEIIMSRNSEMMIHDSWGMCVGNAADMHKMAEDLDRISDNIASIYAERAGGTAQEWREVMRAETWYSAQEAVDAGLAGRIDATADGDNVEASAKASFDLSIFNYAGRRSAPAPTEITRTVAATAAAITPTEEGSSDVAFTDEQVGELREALSLPEESTDQEVFDAVLEELTAPTEDPAGDDPAASANQNVSASAAQAFAKAHGLVLVEASAFQETRQMAERGAKALDRQESTDREKLVSDAVHDGRIPTARKAAWLKQLEADPGAADVLASLPKGTIPVAEAGHGVASNEQPDTGWFGTVTTKGA